MQKKGALGEFPGVPACVCLCAFDPDLGAGGFGREEEARRRTFLWVEEEKRTVFAHFSATSSAYLDPKMTDIRVSGEFWWKIEDFCRKKLVLKFRGWC